MLSLPTPSKDLMSVLGSVCFGLVWDFIKILLGKGGKKKTETPCRVLHHSLTCNNEETEVLKTLQEIMTRQSLF